MRIAILKDKRISTEELNELKESYAEFINNLTGIKVKYFVYEKDYSDYPTYIDGDGDERPTNGFLLQETDFIHGKHGNWGTDHVAILIHEDNWKSDPPGKGGIWGTNYSNIYHGYQVHYCRFDRDNKFNSFGTFHHEIGHSFDALTATELAINIAQIVDVPNWDRYVIHGRSDKYAYIRYNENGDALKKVGIYLKQSYKRRQDRFDAEYQGLQRSVVQLLQTLIVLLRQQFNRKNGVNKLCSNHFHSQSLDS